MKLSDIIKSLENNIKEKGDREVGSVLVQFVSGINLYIENGGTFFIKESDGK